MATTNGLLTFGETMGLISTTRIGTLDIANDARISIGGAESNVAIGVARLGHPVTWIGRVGRDAVGDLIQRRLSGENIDTHIIRDNSYTGLMVRHHRTGSSVHVDYHRRGSAGSHLQPADIPLALLEQAQILHITGITPALSETAADTVFQCAEAAQAAGVTVSIDVNYRSKLWNPDQAQSVLAALIARCDIVFAGVEEAALVTGSGPADTTELAAKLAALGPAEAIIKDGARGCTALINGQHLTQTAISVRALDPVGAGDAFVAGYLAERLGDARPEQRLATAVAVGAYAVTVPGDCELLPTRAELADVLRPEDVAR
jgi:2-dehydro-3-deoxygluconokinase